MWVYPNATRADFEAVIAALHAQGMSVDDPPFDPEFVEVYGDDYNVSLTAAGHDGAPTQVMLVNAK